MSTTDILLLAILAVQVLHLAYATETGRRIARRLGNVVPNWRTRRALRRARSDVV